MNQTTPTIQPKTIEAMLDTPKIRERFNAMLGQRAPQFISSLITVYRGFSQPVEPASVIASAAIAATLDLPIEKNLGFAHIVPYGGVAQFQIGYKGLIQLALRSGQYSGMNASTINKECFGGYDSIGDPIIKWDLLDGTKPICGYVFAWRLINGFTKTIYWPKLKVLAHAELFSYAYRKKQGPWVDNPDAMGLKTVTAHGLRRWGILSVQMQIALKFDQAIIKSIDAEPIYQDAVSSKEPEAILTPKELPAFPPEPARESALTQQAPEDQLRPKRGRPRKEATPDQIGPSDPKGTLAFSSETEQGFGPLGEPSVSCNEFLIALAKAKTTPSQAIGWMIETGQAQEGISDMREVPDGTLSRLVRNKEWLSLVAQMKMMAS